MSDVTVGIGGDGGRGGAVGGAGGQPGAGGASGSEVDVSVLMSLEALGVVNATGTQSVVPPLHGCPVAVFTPHAAVHSQPLQADITCNAVAPVSKYQLESASLMLTPFTRNCVKIGCPDKQCERQVALNTPVPAGSAAMSARVPL